MAPQGKTKVDKLVRVNRAAEENEYWPNEKDINRNNEPTCLCPIFNIFPIFNVFLMCIICPIFHLGK